MGSDNNSTRDYQRRRREAARAAGLCLSCCRRPPEAHYASCSICYERRRAGYQAARALVKERQS